MADANAREYREDALSAEVDRGLPPSTARTRGVVRPPGATSRERVVDDPPVSGAAAHSANRELTKASPPPAAALRAVARVYVLALALIALLAGAGRVEAQDASRRAAEETIATAPVEIDGAVLFEVRGVASYPAEVRARSVNERIVAAAADPAVPVDSLRVIDTESAAELAAGDRPIMMVFDADAALEQVGRGELARTHLLRIRQAILEYRAARTPAALRGAAVRTLIATLLLALGVALAGGSGIGSTRSWRAGWMRASTASGFSPSR